MAEPQEVANEEAPTFEPPEKIERVPEPDIKNEVKEETSEEKEESNKPEIANKTKE